MEVSMKVNVFPTCSECKVMKKNKSQINIYIQWLLQTCNATFTRRKLRFGNGSVMCSTGNPFECSETPMCQLEGPDWAWTVLVRGARDDMGSAPRYSTVLRWRQAPHPLPNDLKAMALCSSWCDRGPALCSWASWTSNSLKGRCSGFWLHFHKYHARDRFEKVV